MDAVITTQEEFDRLFAGVVEDFSGIDWDPFLDRSLGAIEEEHGVMFAAEREASGSPWAPLAPSTVKRKGHNRILVHTDRLRGSLTQRNHGDGIRETFDQWPKIAGLVFGSDVPYGRFHETGTAIMPARPHVGMSDKTLDFLTDQAADFALAELVP